MTEILVLLHSYSYSKAIEDILSASIVLGGENSQLEYGRNGLFVRPTGIEVTTICFPRAQRISIKNTQFVFSFHSIERIKERTAFFEALTPYLRVGESCDLNGLMPLIIAAREKEHLRFYYYVDHGEAGALFLKFYESAVEPDCTDFVAAAHTALKECNKSFTHKKHLLNDSCGYLKWKPEYELERKFTFFNVPDTWKLICDLYDEVRNGSLAGFVPELRREFQVFDYESYLYAIDSPSEEAGYISFIPQADGKTTVKRKWFVENSELRKEHIEGNIKIEASRHAYEDYIRRVTSANVRRLPGFRRKRFDVNFESLNTGHVYGVYFDICRVVEKEDNFFFAQCEVEYCRTRSLVALENVQEEFEQVASFVEKFLSVRDAQFQCDLYSKRDFLNDAENGINRYRR